MQIKHHFASCLWKSLQPVASACEQIGSRADVLRYAQETRTIPGIILHNEKKLQTTGSQPFNGLLFGHRQYQQTLTPSSSGRNGWPSRCTITIDVYVLNKKTRIGNNIERKSNGSCLGTPLLCAVVFRSLSDILQYRPSSYWTIFIHYWQTISKKNKQGDELNKNRTCCCFWYTWSRHLIIAEKGSNNIQTWLLTPSACSSKTAALLFPCKIPNISVLFCPAGDKRFSQQEVLTIFIAIP